MAAVTKFIAKNNKTTTSASKQRDILATNAYNFRVHVYKITR